jgi:2-polyprenyl-3-methyl-5-hydroxy-6-metoxy-1,4-benzoquinol methylase
MSDRSDTLRRVQNALRRLLAGLPLRNAPPSPEVPTQVFRTLGSIYRFAADRVAGRAVLDWGCGTGFGAPLLAAGGARSVLGVDPDAKAIRYARGRFAGDTVTFRVAPLEQPLENGDAPVDVMVAVDSLARLPDPAATLSRVVEGLSPEGVLIASLPPILDGPTLELHRARHPAAARLFLWDWAELLDERFGELALYGHQPPEGVRLELASPRPSHLSEAAFRFEEIPLDDLDNVGTLGAVFVAGSPRR